mmetsp:Transcript_57770/g.135366  ORF Transcript_57770/g.135366 Transcript_57770/m.135366 type:complete len:255 (-) Transcript_57770:8-772(-)
MPRWGRGERIGSEPSSCQVTPPFGKLCIQAFHGLPSWIKLCRLPRTPPQRYVQLSELAPKADVGSDVVSCLENTAERPFQRKILFHHEVRNTSAARAAHPLGAVDNNAVASSQGFVDYAGRLLPCCTHVLLLNILCIENLHVESLEALAEGCAICTVVGPCIDVLTTTIQDAAYAQPAELCLVVQSSCATDEQAPTDVIYTLPRDVRELLLRGEIQACRLHDVLRAALGLLVRMGGHERCLSEPSKCHSEVVLN